MLWVPVALPVVSHTSASCNKPIFTAERQRYYSPVKLHFNGMCTAPSERFPPDGRPRRADIASNLRNEKARMLLNDRRKRAVVPTLCSACWELSQAHTCISASVAATVVGSSAMRRAEWRR